MKSNELKNIKQYVTEVLHISDPAERKLIEKRIIDAVRTARAASAAAELARKNGNEELAKKLEARAAELQELAKNAYMDVIDDTPEQENDSEVNSSDDSGADTDSEESSDKDSEENSNKNDSKDAQQDSDADENDDSTSNNSEDKDAEDKSLAGQDNGESQDQNSESDANDDSSDTNSDSDSKNDSDSDSKSDEDAEDTDNDADSENDEEDTDEDAENGEPDDEESEDEDGANGDSDSEEESDSDKDIDSDSDSDSDSSSSSSSSDSDSDSEEGDEGEESDSDEDEDKEEETDDSPVKDPFADEEDIPQLNLGSPQGQEPRDATLEDIIKELKGLKGKAKDGAVQALKDIQDDRGSGEKNESLSEGLLTEAKNIRELSDDEYAELINSTLDMIDQAGEELTYDDDGENRKQRVKELGSQSVRRELTKEISDDAVKAHKEVKAREKELNRYKNCKSIEEFELNFYNTINTEVQYVKQKKRTWNEINNDYESEDILVKADTIKKHLEEIVPVVDFYFDCSGSWTGYPEAIKIGRRAVATVKEFADDGLIKLNVYYFGRNSLSSDMYAVWGGGTGCWDDIIKNIKKTGATNVVLMTDGDMESQAKWGPGVKVDGCVWFIWGLGDGYGPGYSEQGHEIPKKLIGIVNNTHYAFDVKKK